MITLAQVREVARCIALTQSSIGHPLDRNGLESVITAVTQTPDYSIDNPLHGLKRAESVMVDVVNLLDQADDRRQVADWDIRQIVKAADDLLGTIQKEIEWAEREPEPIGED